MKDKARSFRFNPVTNVYLKEIAEKYHVSETKIIETLVLMIHSDVIPDPGRPWAQDYHYCKLDSFEWFLKN